MLTGGRAPGTDWFKGPLPLPKLAAGDAAFARWLGASEEEWWAFEDSWRRSEEAQRWVEAEEDASSPVAIEVGSRPLLLAEE